MTVFPGGAVEPRSDTPATIGWIGPDPRLVGRRTGRAGACGRAPWWPRPRELFEETGVLLAELRRAPVPSADSTEHEPARTILDRRTRAARRRWRPPDLRLRADLLRPWANWITPPGRTRRYDTFFFAAALPDGQQAGMLTTEADLGQWRTPQALFAERDAGITALMPPTMAMLTDLAGFGSVADVMAARAGGHAGAGAARRRSRRRTLRQEGATR